MKNIIPGSAADHNGQIHVHDKIVAVSKIFCLYIAVELIHFTSLLKEQHSKDFLKLIKPPLLFGRNNLVVGVCLGRLVTEMSFGLLWLKYYFIFKEVVNST